MVNFGCGLWFRRSKDVDQTPALEAPHIWNEEKVSEADKEDLLGEEWQSDFAIRVQKASKTHFSRLQRLSEESNLHSALVVLQTEYQQRAIPLNLAKWEPVLEAMDSFTIGINQLMQASPSACNFLWGSILLLLQCALRHARIMSQISAMLTDISNILPRCHLYVHLFSLERLQAPLKNIYRDYADFIVSTMEFLAAKPYSKLTLLHI
ncbi:hypothetical protein LTR91_014407 [Friedmanniomyces endolithicus]|uniref:DUF7708 domain-containing protein n=1 Tax=Friedmanniomyces endolithicus TaxID=329885 RepID=A0AAN6KCD4_9PEZI|nr:hypothetical protein LTR57_021363 [Friedmanniomyces endolithicus]KAK0960996.1 hypothetical protein LTS01_020592 [Friedmanniomyces endolithicus]KAK0974348.1 hypothetical protein LTR91_014407 [Friedmanniomyces endolithicus]KAK1026798.1 hypothetical protein LTS16_022009 [Friedmanniomyces endolithicus]KAK1089141.1 hypothetical protein LTR33_000212 [Friedmanniomyces endolithicus]